MARRLKPAAKRLTTQRAGTKPARALIRLSPEIWPLAALAILVFLVFSNTLGAGLALDSITVVQKDPRVRAATIENLRLIAGYSYYWPSGEAGLYRPLTTLSFLLTASHWFNLLLHVANTFLLFTLARRIVRRFWPPLAIAAVWAVHPILTEAVSNVAGRADLLAAFSVFAGLLVYLKARDSGARVVLWIALAAVTALGVFAKENAVILPALFVLYEIAWWKERRFKALLVGCIAASVPIAAMLWQRSIVLENSAPAEFPFVDNPILGAGFVSGRATAFRVMVRYVGLLLWPADLSSDYSYASIVPSADTSSWIILGLGVSILSIALVLMYRAGPAIFFFGGLAFVAFLPVSNLVFPIGTVMAERLLYLPSAGFAACAVLAIFWAAERVQRPRAAIWLLVFIAILLGIRTWRRNMDWQDEMSIVSADAANNPPSFKLHTQLARLMYESNPSSIDAIISEAERGLSPLASLSNDRNAPDPYRMAGGYYLVKAELQHAPDAYKRAIEILLRAVAIESSLRKSQDEKLEVWRARDHRDIVVPLPDDSASYQLLTAAYLRLGNRTAAVEAARQALARVPRNPQAYREIAATLLDQNLANEASVALTLGSLLAPGAGLERDLAAIDPARRNYCPASEQAIRALLREGRVKEAEQQRSLAAQDHGC